MKIGEYRSKLAAENGGVDPYADLTDVEFASRLHKRYYADIDLNDFMGRVGVEGDFRPRGPTSRAATKPSLNDPVAPPVEQTALAMPTDPRLQQGALDPNAARRDAEEKAAARRIPGEIGQMAGGMYREAGANLRRSWEDLNAAAEIGHDQKLSSGQLEPEDTGAWMSPSEIARDIARQNAPGASERAFGHELDSARMKRRARGARADIETAIAPEAGGGERAIVQGVSSTLFTAPIVTAGALVPGGQVPALTALGGTTGLNRYYELIDQGVPEGAAAMSGLYLGGLEALTEAIPLGTLAKQSPFIRQAAEFTVQDVLGENISTVAEIADNYRLGLRDEVTIQDLKEAIKETTGATIVGAGAQVSLSQITQAVIDGANAKALQREPQIEQPPAPQVTPPTLTDVVAEPGGPTEEITLEGDGELLPGEIGVEETQPDEDITLGEGSAPVETPVKTGPKRGINLADGFRRGGTAGVQVDEAEHIDYEGVPEPTFDESPPKTAAERRAQVEEKKQDIRNAFVDQPGRGVTYVAGENGFHGIAVNGRARAWFRNEATARQVADEMNDEIAKATLDPQADADAEFREYGTRPKTFAQRAHEAATSPKNDRPEPTPGQVSAGNYKKGHVRVHGMEISIENPIGSIRRSKPDAPTQWERKITKGHYGYIRGTEDNTGENVDVFVGPNRKSPRVYVIDQVIDGKFDEPKVMLGYMSEEAARKAYLANYQKGWKGIGAITEMPVYNFKQWVTSRKAKEPVAWTSPRDPRLDQRADQLKHMAARAGWAEEGGRVITDQDPVKPTVTGRTKWLPHEDWFADVQRTAPLSGNTAGKATAKAVEKAVAGEKLTAAEERHVKAMLDYVDSEEVATKELVGRLADDPSQLSDAELNALEAKLERLAKQDFSLKDEEEQIEIPVGRGVVSEEPMFERGAREFTREELNAIADEIQEKYGLAGLELYPRGNNRVELAHIEVSKGDRRQGKGSAAMNAITAWADSNGQRLLLTPALRDDGFGTTSRSRLVQFYKRFGFVENKGRKKDFTFTNGMYRDPRESTPMFERDTSDKATGDLFGDKTEVRDALKKLEAEKDRRRNTGRADPDTGKPGDLFTRPPAQQEDLFKREPTAARERDESQDVGGDDERDVDGNPLPARSEVQKLPELTPEQAAQFGPEAPTDVLGNKQFTEHSGFKLGDKVKSGAQTGVIRRIFELKKEPPKKLGVSRVRAEVRWDDGTAQYVDVDKLKHAPAVEQVQPDKKVTAAEVIDFHKRLMNGDVSLDEYKRMFAAIPKSRDALIAEFEGMTKDELIKIHRDPYRNSEKKAWHVSHAYEDMLARFTRGEGVSFAIGGNYQQSYENAIAKIVESATEEDLKAYAAKIKKQRDEHAEALKGFENPQTLEDFKNFIRYKGESKLTTEQMERYDALFAESARARLKDAKERRERERAQVQSAGRTVGAKVIATKHTKKGHDIFVVQMEERVERDVYDTLNRSAKQLGGYYSSYRGGGAIPGFTFTEADKAEAFAKLLQTGDTAAATEVAQQRREDFQDDKSQTSVERLRSMAERLEEAAQESLNADRKTNTARRARMANNAESMARSDLSMARTMRNIANAIDEGKAVFLEGVRTKAQVQMLRRMLHDAQYDQIVAESKERNGEFQYRDYEERNGEQPTRASARYVRYPRYSIRRGDLAQLGRELVDVQGAKQLGTTILKSADDVTEKYEAFVKDNLSQVALATEGGRMAVFATKAMAEAARKRSPGHQKMVVVNVGKARNHVVLSPREAQSRGLWTGDDDKTFNLGEEMALEIIEKVNAHNAKAGWGERITLPWTFDDAKEKRARLKSMGIDNPPMLREAMREYIALLDDGPKADPVKLKMRELAGRSNVGIDFFPTPQGEAANLVAKADIKEGMDVLEPSAGYGAIADEIREAGVDPDVVEMSSTLREILELKGYQLVGSDFMAYSGKQYDRIVMNPPFSSGMDIDHVRHAYDLLKPGGRIVAIMGQGAFYRSDKKATEFREWADGLGAIDEELPEGTFLDPSLPATTGVNARVIVIDKPDAPMAKKGLVSPKVDALPARAVRDEVNRILREFKTRPRLLVVDRHDQLPPDLKRAIQQRGGELGVQRALQWNGGIYLIASQYNNLADVLDTVIHETVVHYGLRSVLDPDTHHSIVDGLARDQSEVVKRMGRLEFGDRYDHNNAFMRRIAAEEVLAYYAPVYIKGRELPSGLKKWLDKFIEAIKSFIARVVGSKPDTMVLPDDYNREAMNRIIDALERYLKTGKGPDYVESADQAAMAEKARYPRAGKMVDGRKVRDEVPNVASISATFDRYKILPGIREVQLSEFPAPPSRNQRSLKLAEKIKESGEISPLIVGIDSDGPFIIEGSHRYDALKIIGAKSFPAVVVVEDGADFGAPLFERPQPAPVFYSELTRAAEQSKTNRAPAHQWIATLRTSKGVKTEELEWSGVEDWLKEQNGPITKQALVDFLRANEVQVEEVLKGDNLGANKTREIDRVIVDLTAKGFTPVINDDWSGPELEAVTRNSDGARFVWDKEQQAWVAWKNGFSDERLPDELSEHLGKLQRALFEADTNDLQNEGETRYSQYTLPGGNRYRELLLTMPPKEDVYGMAKRKAVYDRYQPLIDKTDDTEGSAAFNESQRLRRERDAEADAVYRLRKGNEFKSGHWGESNILAHVRFNERTDADGKRVLFVEEIQSDWHQTGRKRGYQKAKPTDEDVRQFFDVDPSVWSTIDQAERDAYRQDMVTGITNRTYRGVDLGVPDAPFKRSWPELAFKRVLRWASENGFDRVAWTTGAQQAERYNLGTVLSRIEYQVIEDGKWRIRPYTVDDPDSIANIGIPAALTKDQIAEHYGNDIAKRIAGGEGREIVGFRGSKWRELSGMDLRVGDDGMTGFYDDILPKTVNKLVKKWGAQVRAGTIKAMAPDPMSAGMPYNAPAHVLDITPQMREAALGGLPMFQRSPNNVGQQIAGALRTLPKSPQQARGWTKVANGIIDTWNRKIGGKYGALGNLPEAKQYLIHRYRTLGGLSNVRHITKEIYKALSKANAEDAQAVYEYLTTAGAQPDAIVDEKIRNTAIAVKESIDAQGRQLVDLGLLSEESYEKYRDQYLPRLYLRHVLEEGGGKMMGTGKKMSDQGYLKARKDIPEEVRKVILGEITDPAFLASFAISRVQRDIQIMNFLQQISQNKEWTPPQMLVNWDGRQVSPHWLHAEAKQLRKQADHMKPRPDLAAKARAIADKMDSLANQALDELHNAVDLSQFEQIPDSARYGALRGLYVRKEIHEDLVGAYNFVDSSNLTGLSGVLERTFGQGGVLTKATQAWKTSKVALNAPSHVRNMIGNGMMLHLSGIPAYRIPDRLVSALHSVITKDRWYQIARKYGLEEATFANRELMRIKDEWIRLQKSKGATWNKVLAMLGKGTDTIGNVYQFEEALFKIAKLQDAMEREGMSEADAMIEAHKWVFDYSLVPRWVRYLRNAPFGVPFLSYTYFAAPRLLETAVRRPWKFLPYIALVYALQEALQYQFGGDDDDYEQLRKSFPSWMKEKGSLLLMPTKDANGNWQVVDLGYILPWGQFQDTVIQASHGNLRQSAETLGVLSGPVPDLISVWQTGIDPFTQKPIAQPGDPADMRIKAYLSYMWGMAAPGFLTEVGALGKLKQAYSGEVNPRTGEPKITKTQAWLRLVGINVYPVNPEATRETNLFFLQKDIDAARLRMRQALKDRNLSPDEKAETRRIYEQEVNRRIQLKREYERDSQIPEVFRTKPDDDLTSRVGPLLDGKSKQEAVQVLRDSGMPALASLIESLPAKPRRLVQESLAEMRA